MLREFENMNSLIASVETRNPAAGEPRAYGTYYYYREVIVGPDGKPQVREYSNIPHQPTLPDSEESSAETIVDKERRSVKVVLEIPGVDPKDLNVQGSSRTITVTGRKNGTFISKEIPLDVDVDFSTIEKSYKNGVLEISLKLK
jgi:HSP20 family protein